MEKLAFIIPVQFNDDGMPQIKNLRSLNRLVACLKDRYDITLIVQTHREKRLDELNQLGVSVIYDGSPQVRQCSEQPSRFQISYERWAGRESAASRYDCLVAWDGCSPWCLATALTCVTAKRRILYLYDDPKLYLMPEDYTFYTALCNQFAFVASADVTADRALEDIFGVEWSKDKHTVLSLPINVAWYWEQSSQPIEYSFVEEEINVLAMSRMSIESDLESLPRRIAEFHEKQPLLHCYLIGNGERLNRYVQQVAVYDADSMFRFLGAQENPYPYIKACDALIVCEDEFNQDAVEAAKAFAVPIVRMDELEQRLPKLRKHITPNQSRHILGPDENQWIRLLKGE